MSPFTLTPSNVLHTNENHHRTPNDSLDVALNLIRQPREGTDTIPETTIKEVMARIYKDIHDTSSPGSTNSTADISIDSGILDEPLRSGIQSDLAINRKKVFRVIKYAQVFVNTDSSSLFANDLTAHNSVRDIPDDHGKAQMVAKIHERLIRRYGSFASDHGWMLLSILAHSTSFRHTCMRADEASWSKITVVLENFSESLETFAKIRGLDWQSALAPYSLSTSRIRETFSLTPGHPHSVVIPSEGQVLTQPIYRGESQMETQTSMCRLDTFACKSRPRAWDSKRPYPSHPMLRAPASHPCAVCFSKTACECDPSALLTHPLVELKRYPNKGVGIRSLQKIQKGDVLAEYLGEIIHPATCRNEDIYSLVVDEPPHDHNTDEITIVTAARWGNWTRYINHSCEANTCFDVKVVGPLERWVVVAEKDVEFGAEVTINYGADYFREGLLCRCGSERCLYGSVEDIGIVREIQRERRERFVAEEAETEMEDN
ncbi:hypothetical protein MMC12_006011 [Toensbergia leucococca]|nr:hypothetical protein [Toensbergia leucococca]